MVLWGCDVYQWCTDTPPIHMPIHSLVHVSCIDAVSWVDAVLGVAAIGVLWAVGFFGAAYGMRGCTEEKEEGEKTGKREKEKE